MAGNRNILVSARSNARRYAKLSKGYAPWVPEVKNLVNRAEGDDWGTFVVACALLELVIPQDLRLRIEREIRLDELENEYRQGIKHKRRACCRICTVGAAILCLIGAVIWVLILNSATSGILGDAFDGIYGIEFQNNWLVLTIVKLICPLFKPLFLPVFSLIGAISVGYTLGALGDKGMIAKSMALVFSCVIGFVCAFLCPILPPLSFIFAWCAWRSLNVAKLCVAEEIPRQFDVAQYGHREFALDPRAPRFVKNAIHLAGMFRDTDGHIGQIAREALSRRQTDYGAFVVYGAVLSRYFEHIRAERIAKEEEKEATREANVTADDADISIGNNDVEVDEQKKEAPVAKLGSGSADSDKKCSVSNKTSTPIYGICVALFVAIAMRAMMNIGVVAMVISSSGITVFTILLMAMCVLLGYQSAARALRIYGLSSKSQAIVAVVRAMWFSAWLVFVTASVLFLCVI